MAAPASGTDSKESTAANDRKTPPRSPKSSSGFYGYLFDEKKAPTPTLDGLLRAIAKHIIAEIGDKNIHNLTPPKLAAFYKAVGGDYDSLFVGVPYESISFIWQFTGCQYSLQPVEGRDYEAPSIPALTLRGFVRWESIEILLGPEEHVPFIQHAVKHWALKHPETGEAFPPDLPKEAFPSAADPDIDKWHKSCAEKLRQRATPTFEQAAFRSSAAESSRPHSAEPTERAEPKARMPYAHIRNPNNEPPLKGRREPDYFARPVRVVHGPGRVPSQRVQIPPTERQKFRPGSSSDERTRRRSLSDYPSPPVEGGQPFNHLHAERPGGPPRRHSQPRHHSSSSSPDDSDDASPRTRHRPGSSAEDAPRRRGTVRIVPAGNHPTPPSSSQSHSHGRGDDPRKRSLPFTVPEVIRGGFDKVTSFVTSRSPERHRSSSGRRSDREREREREREASRRTREHMISSKLRGSWDDLEADESDASDSSIQRRTRMKLRRAEKDAQIREEDLRMRERERERERERDRGRDRGRARQDRERDWERERERERDEELELRKRRDREQFLQRPETYRRTSSHADIDRMREEAWDPREREFREDKRRWKGGERATSPMTGVTGRRYPPEPVWK